MPLETVLDRQAAGQIDKIERSSSNTLMRMTKPGKQDIQKAERCT